MKGRELVFVSLLLGVATGRCYEVGTHAHVTKLAVDGSVLSATHPKSIVPVLGFDRLDEITPVAGRYIPGILDHQYFDNLSTATIDLSSEGASDLIGRDPQNQEGAIFERLIARGYLPGVTSRADWEYRIPAWVMRGAIREDDNDFGSYSIGDRDEDPWSNVFRAGRHFYDPINNRALDSGGICGVFGCMRATEWAMGRTGVLAGPGTIDAGSENHFSWQHARNQYWWALTYKSSDLGVNTYAEAQARHSARRSRRMATMLKAIGQVVHLAQDMAQPQHTRNDSHGPPATTLLTGDSRADGVFEAYTEARLFRELPEPGYSNPLSHFDGAKLTVDDLPSIKIQTYPAPSFSTAVEYFTTQQSDSAVALRRGISDLSNRGFFTTTTLPVNVASLSPDPLVGTFSDNPPQPAENAGFYEEFPLATKLYASGSVVRSYHLIAPVPDVLQPNWNAQSGFFTEYSANGRLPLLTASQSRIASDLIAVPTPESDATVYSMSYDVYTATADAMLSRAVGYSRGLIDYFFRGRLEVTPTTQNAFAVLNQGEPHTVDADGYPRRPNDSIFGFEKVRLRVRNISDAITESGPATPAIPQASGNGTLVAVARYHRNACYKQNMSGERVRAYAPPPSIGAITEPVCTGTTPVRTKHQEISVSAPIMISSATDLPGGEGVGGSAVAVEKAFDFSADPIPVNATDLFIQVVYRGQLGEEPDGIAVGTYDVREPTFIGIYNNTDYYWNGTVTQWLSHFGSQFPWQNADYVRVCTGASTESRWAYYAEPIAGFPPLGVPSPDPGVIRLAIIFAKPNGAQQFSVRVTPVMADGLNAFERSFATPGTQKQANKEIVDAAVTNAPQFCTQTAPTGATYWCDDPISKRRGLALGRLVHGVYYDTGLGNTGGDVDAQPLPQFAGLRLTATGTVKWNDATLVACPPPPTAAAGSVELIELLEQAADEGILVE